MSDNDCNSTEEESPGVQVSRRLADLMLKTGYPLVQVNGQSIYGPPPTWPKYEEPPRGSELFIGKIPRDCYEDELVPVFSSVGVIFEFRLMLDFSGTNRGYGFVKYTNPKDAKMALMTLDNYPIRNTRLRLLKSTDNRRLYMGNIPRHVTREQVFNEITMMADGVNRVIMHTNANNKNENRGFAFVEFMNHRLAAMARRSMIPGGIRLWDTEIVIDWAQPELEVDDDVMSQVRALYLRNLPVDIDEAVITSVIRPMLEQSNAGNVGDSKLPKLGNITRVKKIKDFAFVHFTDRATAEFILDKIEDVEIMGVPIEAEWAKPVVKGNQQLTPRRRILRNVTQNNSPLSTSSTSTFNGQNLFNNNNIEHNFNKTPVYNNKPINNIVQTTNNLPLTCVDDKFDTRKYNTTFDFNKYQNLLERDQKFNYITGQSSIVYPVNGENSFNQNWSVLNVSQFYFQTGECHAWYSELIWKFNAYGIELPDFKFKVVDLNVNTQPKFLCMGTLPSTFNPRFYFLSRDYSYELEDALCDVLYQIVEKLPILLPLYQAPSVVQ